MAGEAILLAMMFGGFLGAGAVSIAVFLDHTDNCAALESEAVQRDDYEEARYWRDAPQRVCSDVWRHRHGE